MLLGEGEGEGGQRSSGSCFSELNVLRSFFSLTADCISIETRLHLEHAFLESSPLHWDYCRCILG